MRTTLTLDDDAASKLKSLARRSGRAFRDVVNDALRRGLARRAASPPREPFKVEARDLGRLRPGLNLDNIGDLIEQARPASSMILVDANLLLYANDPRAAQHEATREWLKAVLRRTDLVRFAWLTLWAFLRISTNPRVFEHPLSVGEAERVVSSWLGQPVAGILEPAERHWEILRGLTDSFARPIPRPSSYEFLDRHGRSQ
jgi:toxin-antitoxin system PIN domain toxin